jgi:hypothetical protein
VEGRNRHLVVMGWLALVTVAVIIGGIVEPSSSARTMS